MSESDSDDSSSSSVPMPELMPHPLFEAIASGDLDTVKRLIANVPVDCTHLVSDIGTTGCHGGWTPLERAAYNGRVDVVKYLIRVGADAEGSEEGFATGDTPLICAIISPSCPNCIVSILLQAGATIPEARLRFEYIRDEFLSQYLQKILKAGGFKAHAKTHRQKLVAMFVRTRCFQPVPDEIVPLIVDYGFHVGFY